MERLIASPEITGRSLSISTRELIRIMKPARFKNVAVFTTSLILLSGCGIDAESDPDQSPTTERVPLAEHEAEPESPAPPPVQEDSSSESPAVVVEPAPAPAPEPAPEPEPEPTPEPEPDPTPEPAP